MERVLDKVAIAASFALGIGLAPAAPGTFGSLPGLALAFALYQATAGSPPVIALSLGLATAFAWWAIARCERVLGIHDDQRIVIDEVVGQALAVAFLPPAWTWYLAGFILFRLFDVSKPGPIGRIDREMPGAAGTLLDDVAAGALAALLLGVAYLVMGRLG